MTSPCGGCRLLERHAPRVYPTSLASATTRSSGSAGLCSCLARTKRRARAFCFRRRARRFFPDPMVPPGSTLGTPTTSGPAHRGCPDGRSMRGTSQVYRRSITPWHREPLATPPHQASGRQARAIRHDLQYSPRRRKRAGLSDASRGILRTVSAAEPTTVAHVCSMFARMSRYGLVAAGITRHPLRGLPYSPAGRGTPRHRMVRGRGVKSNRAAGP